MPKEMSIWRKILNPLMNERGEIGDVQATPESGSQTESQAAPAVSQDEGVNWEGDAYSPAPDAIVPPTVAKDASGTPGTEAKETGPPAGALKPDTTGAPKPGEAAPGTEPGPIPYSRFKEVNDEVTTHRANAENYQRMAEFYQTQYNELVAQMQGGQPPKPGAETKPADATTAQPGVELPAGIKAPES